MDAANPFILVPITNPNLFVITGAPGAGKTALVDELECRGYRCAHEAARKIIQEQVRDSGDALPWANTSRYAEMMLTRSIASYLVHTPASTTTFSDRGIPDTLCYARVIDLPVTAEMRFACDSYRYNQRVFMAPPWKEIYSTDAERKQTYDEAVRVHQIMVQVYEESGYQCVELPKVSVEERTAFVLVNLQ